MKYEAVQVMQKFTSLHIVIFLRKLKCSIPDWSVFGLMLFTEEYDYELSISRNIPRFRKIKKNFDISSLRLITS